MQNDNGQNGFTYTYSAAEQEELKRIREKYANRPQEENKMERLRRLDARVLQRAQTVALIFGIVGALILGLGMSLAMSDLALYMGLTPIAGVVVGIIIGVPGGVLAALACPIYRFVLCRERAKVAPEILRLTDELMK